MPIYNTVCSLTIGLSDSVRCKALGAGVGACLLCLLACVPAGLLLLCLLWWAGGVRRRLLGVLSALWACLTLLIYALRLQACVVAVFLYNSFYIYRPYWPAASRNRLNNTCMFHLPMRRAGAWPCVCVWYIRIRE